MKYLIILLSIIFLFISCDKKSDSQNNNSYVPVTEFDPARDAQKDIDNAIAEAQRSGRYILLDVGGNWCSWCKKLDSFFEENEDVTKFMNNNYVVVKINYSKENKNEEVLSQYPDIGGYPHFFVLDRNGKLVHSQNTGELEEGDHHDRDKVFSFLQKYAPGH